MTHLWWARRDLRLHDNPALIEAQHQGAAAVFAWTPALHFWPGRRRAHLARVLWSLRESTAGALAVRRGDAAAVVLGAAREVGATTVWAAREYSPAGVREQDEVAAALASDGRKLAFVGSPYAVAPGRVVKADGTPYRVFTPFRAAWREHGWRPPAPAANPSALVALAATDDDVDLDQRAAHGDAEDPLERVHEFREDRVLADLEAFIEDHLTRYGDDRDRPDLDATSRLSPALALGVVHPRTVLALTAGSPHPGARTFESEVAWREFHADVLHHHPEAQRTSLTTAILDDDWETGAQADAHFDAWREGRTGFPLVDAGMRQLASTGWMHGRVRMVVASFLIKDLHLPWQRGADHFRRTLIDYDHAQNQLNWQWVAGTGRDAAPFFRVFNPQAQQERYDPHRRYVERWVPELDTPAYPEPIVDHRAEREATLAAHRRARTARGR